jgi:hypothetical protein
MGCDGLFNIAGEVFVDHGRGVLRQQGDARFDGAARGRCRVQNGHWMRTVLDDDLRAQTDASHQAREVAGGICFRDVDGCHTHHDAPDAWCTAWVDAIRAHIDF